uniref:uncharacterized protein LOC120338013 n=1 Tax=Styela clava TaxID=7725 RepID=UPI00193ACF06|nr:uncharacterized protein LOC120338013 [Styela clava]
MLTSILITCCFFADFCLGQSGFSEITAVFDEFGSGIMSADEGILFETPRHFGAQLKMAAPSRPGEPVITVEYNTREVKELAALVALATDIYNHRFTVVKIWDEDRVRLKLKAKLYKLMRHIRALMCPYSPCSYGVCSIKLLYDMAFSVQEAMNEMSSAWAYIISNQPSIIDIPENILQEIDRIDNADEIAADHMLQQPPDLAQQIEEWRMEMLLTAFGYKYLSNYQPFALNPFEYAFVKGVYQILVEKNENNEYVDPIQTVSKYVLQCNCYSGFFGSDCTACACSDQSEKE